MDSPAIEKDTDLDWVDAKWDTTGAPAARLRYALAGSGPTGSRYVSRELRRGGLGVPFPYFDETLMPKIAARLGCWDVYGQMEIDDYLAALAAKRTTANGVFGVEARPHQLRPFFGDGFSKALDFWRRFDKVIVLRRRDKLLQAIAAARSRIERLPEDRASRIGTGSPFLYGIISDCLNMAVLGDGFSFRIANALGSDKVRVLDFEDLSDHGTIASTVQWLVDGRMLEPSLAALSAGGEAFAAGPTEADLDLKQRFLEHIGAFK